MKIIIKTKNLKLTGSLKEYVQKKIISLEKLSGRENFPLTARLEIEKTTEHHKKGPVFRTECQLPLPGKEIRAESVSENLYSTINEVKDELQRELENYKNKSVARTKRGARILKKEIRLSSGARFYKKGRIKDEGI
ncbi:MAG TPA: ribosome-associated translation inhibitor RaiA [Patescibacteria group bacterium]|nr:ribosome-associated translation inhibitor RaiA [Patescibacteria group bacterium]